MKIISTKFCYSKRGTRDTGQQTRDPNMELLSYALGSMLYSPGLFPGTGIIGLEKLMKDQTNTL